MFQQEIDHDANPRREMIRNSPSSCVSLGYPILLSEILEVPRGVIAESLVDCLPTVATQPAVPPLRTIVVVWDLDHPALSVDPGVMEVSRFTWPQPESTAEEDRCFCFDPAFRVADPARTFQ
jgi:hypothetical protein